ncbi:hemerythrin HHE cation binding domain-containing protein [Histoplasma ohiense]|nr:hemerythrin HHE cation binding domain-containing protein [Histoplasma ohiense (nom. inval.)]
MTVPIQNVIFQVLPTAAKSLLYPRVVKLHFKNMANNDSPPMYTDTPLAVIPTPKFETGNEDQFTIEASHMALSHNAFIRGFNSIYQQASRLREPTDKSDFVGYCQAWIECVKTHHHYEETDLFPNINKAAGTTGLMADAVQEHELFYGGMDRMKAYLDETGAQFSAAELISIMDSFKEPLHSHLKAEPPAIVDLARYNTEQNPIDIMAIAAAAGKKQVGFSFFLNTVPVFFLNMETATFEGGMWHGVFPPLKGFARTLVNNIVPMWHSGRWRFASCTPDGEYKQLAV